MRGTQLANHGEEVARMKYRITSDGRCVVARRAPSRRWNVMG